MNPDLTAPTPFRFDCPACHAVLTVPAAAAGLQGPCPKCWQEIVSPDPARGLPARIPAAPEAPAVLPAPAAAPKSRGIGGLIPSLLFSAAFAAVGYQLGKRQRPPEIVEVPAVAETPEIPQPQPVVPTTPPDPEPAPIPVQPTPPPDPARPTAEATLRAFLEAPDWKTRGDRVLDPAVILPALEKYAAQAGDGPFATTSVGFLEKTGDTHLFKVCTPAIPEGFPVAVTETTEGPMIDWESFIGFHDDHFRKFLQGPSGKSGIFDLLVKPQLDATDTAAAHFVRYRLSVPMPGRETVAWIPKESVALARLRAIFNGSGGFDKATVDRLAETGVPLVLALEKKAANDGRNFIEIRDFVAIGWGPAGP